MPEVDESVAEVGNGSLAHCLVASQWGTPATAEYAVIPHCIAHARMHLLHFADRSQQNDATSCVLKLCPAKVFSGVVRWSPSYVSRFVVSSAGEKHGISAFGCCGSKQRYAICLKIDGCATGRKGIFGPDSTEACQSGALRTPCQLPTPPSSLHLHTQFCTRECSGGHAPVCLYGLTLWTAACLLVRRRW